MLTLLSLYVGALLSSDASPACLHPPCRDTLVATPASPGPGAAVTTKASEGQAGTSSCRLGASVPAASDNPEREEQRLDFPQTRLKVSKTGVRKSHLFH